MRLTQTTWARFLLDARHRWLAVLALFALAIVVGLAGGWLMTVVSAVIVAALVLALVGGLWALRDIEIGYAAMIGVIALLPFGVLPVPFSPKPTFLDLAMLLLFGVWAVQLVTRQQQDFIGGELGVWVLAPVRLAPSSDEGTRPRWRQVSLDWLSILLFQLLIPSEHPLRQLFTTLEWQKIDEQCAPASHNGGFGAPAYPPQLLFRILILMF